MNGHTDTYGMPVQNGQHGMQSYNFAPPNNMGGYSQDKKSTVGFASSGVQCADLVIDYVFVDEHNRHKRLKGMNDFCKGLWPRLTFAAVMRACEGCRKRKIKCDGATTSTWPCGSCTRLKQKCNPPVVNLDRAAAGGSHISGLERVLNFDDDSGSGDEEDYTYANQDGQTFQMQIPTNQMQQQFSAGLQGTFGTPPYTDSSSSHGDFGFNDVAPVPLDLSHASYQDPTAFNPPLSGSLAPSEQSGWNGSNEQYSQPPPDLSDALGELKIHDNGIGRSSQPPSRSE